MIIHVHFAVICMQEVLNLHLTLQYVTMREERNTMKAIVTGASNGIGKDIANALSEKGYDLVLAARSKDKLEILKQQLNTSVEVECLDLSKPESCMELYNKYKDQDIDVLVNNAGFGLFGEFDKTDLDIELNMIGLNITAVHILTKLFVKKMKKQNYGYILNVSSSAAFVSGPLMAAYYSTKAYVLRLTQAINEELRRSKSRVYICALCPGPVATGFGQRANASFALKGLSSKYVAEYAIEKMLRGKPVIIPGLTMKLAKLGVRFLPDKLSARFAYYFQNKKAK